eukprot:c15902_g1_i1 orf=457-2946(-)
MAEPGIDTECKVSNVRKAYWRSTTWNSRSAPTSPKGGQPSAASTSTEDSRAPPFLERQGSRARASLPPLQPLAIARRSLQEWPQAAVDDMDASDWPAPVTPSRRRIKTGPDIRLDLSSLHRAPLEPTDIQRKREKFALFNKECSRVANYHIYLGSDAVAKNKEILKAHGITHVLNCVGFVCPEYFNKDFDYKTLWLQDSPGEDITSLLYDVFDYFEEVGELGGRVFVHCCQGVSRSTSLVIAYMMWRESRSFEEAFQDVKASRGVTNPNMGFACQLLQCQKRVHAAPMSPSSLLRMYRLAPHSPYDPLHLVPKAVNNPGAGALDSRGAFVIHVPLAIYVWIGCDCDPRIAQAARVAAEQVVRYERAQGPMHMLAEGSENDEFWESLGKYGDLVDEVGTHEFDKINANSVQFIEQRKKAAQDQLHRVRNAGAGNRKVPSYSADFELYQRARQGGVVPPVPSTGAGMVGVPTRIPAREDRWSMLRRKFLSGELFPAKETDASDLSLNPSMASSSPLCSPFSITTTTFSPSTAAGSDSVSTSPLSHLSILSPSTSSLDSPESSEAGSCGGRDPTPRHYSSPYLGDQKSFPANRQIPPLNLGSKSPAVLLAKHGGASLAQLLSLEDVHRPTLPLLATEESNTAERSTEGNKIGIKFDEFGEIRSGFETTVPDLEMLDGNLEEDSRDTHVVSEDSEVWYTDSLHAKSAAAADDSGSFLASTLMAGSGKATLEAGDRAVLYTWPQLEKVDRFTADHLSSKGVFILLAPQQLWNGMKNVVYIWVGREHEEHAGVGDLPWQPIGQQFLKQVNCRTGAHIQVVRQGNEPEEFWENFAR